MRIKNKDIAEALGISTAAVSLAVNNKPGVSEETRQKVLQMISDSASRNSELSTPAGTERMVILAFHKKHGYIINEKPFFTQLMEGIQQEAMKHGIKVAIANYLPGQDMEEYLRYINTLHGDGLIIMATEMEKEDLDGYRKLQIPLVLVDASFDLEDVDSVALDNQTAIYRAACYAYKMGHRDIGFLQSTVMIQNFVHHFDGYWKALRELGLLDRNHPVIQLPCRVDEAAAAMDDYLDHLPDDFKMPTVFLADLDYIALGAMKALKKHGYRIPEDVSLIGYDDVPLCEIAEPALTTSRVNQGDAGRLAFHRLLELMNHENTDYCLTAQVSSKLIIRDSVRSLN